MEKLNIHDIKKNIFENISEEDWKKIIASAYNSEIERMSKNGVIAPEECGVEAQYENDNKVKVFNFTVPGNYAVNGVQGRPVFATLTVRNNYDFEVNNDSVFEKLSEYLIEKHDFDYFNNFLLCQEELSREKANIALDEACEKLGLIGSPCSNEVRKSLKANFEKIATDNYEKLQERMTNIFEKVSSNDLTM